MNDKMNAGELLSPLLNNILNKSKDVHMCRCTYCSKDSNKAYVVYSKYMYPDESFFTFYDLILCEDCSKHLKIESSPHIIFDTSNFDKEEILVKLNKLRLLL